MATIDLEKKVDPTYNFVPPRVFEGLHGQISSAIREVTQLRGNVELVQVGSLPNDGKVIGDARSNK